MLNKNIIIKKLGKQIRSEIEVWTKENPDVEEGSLQGACAIASYIMYRSLIKLGFKPQFVMADSGFGAHCWVTLDDDVIDLTATQFNNLNRKHPKVLIIDKRLYLNKISQLKDYKYFSFNKKAIEITKTWDQQNPLVYTKEIKKFIKNLNIESYK